MFLDVPVVLEDNFYGQKIRLEAGLLANQATSSVVGTLGETTVMANVVIGPKVTMDYFPLQVIFEEKLYASGKIHGSRFIKREGRPSENAILTGRMIDRSLRSLFDDSIRSEIQVIITVLSLDEINSPDTLAVIVASTALKLATSEFLGPVSSLRIGACLKDSQELVEKFLSNLENIEDFASAVPQLTPICQLTDGKSQFGKTLLKQVAKALASKNQTWVKEFSQLYNNTKKPETFEIVNNWTDNWDFVINPNYEKQMDSFLDLVVSGTKDNLVMVEAGSKIVPESVFEQAFELALSEFEFLNGFQQNFLDLATAHGLSKNLTLEKKIVNHKLSVYWDAYETEIEAILYSEKSKQEKNEDQDLLVKTHLHNLSLLKTIANQNQITKIDTLHEYLLLHSKNPTHAETSKVDNNPEFNLEIAQNLVEILKFEDGFENLENIKEGLKISYESKLKSIIKTKILEEEQRVDGRHLDEIRPLVSQIDVLPRVHGSSLFSRGETQVLNVLTLGTLRDAQVLDDMEDFEETTKRYIHHYNFPSYSVGEVGRYAGPGRREIGHGALAEKALLPVLPKEEDFPYTIRLVSECLGSNGSTSMASTCASTLSLMSAGVPISYPVAGIAMGLVKDDTSNNFKVLTDIQGLEDHFGEMDFKVTGTKDGITAIQLDNKVAGLTPEILKVALEKAKIARYAILEKIHQTIQKPRDNLSPQAPGVEILHIPVDKIGEIIGPSGKNIKAIIAKYQVEIDISDENGTTYIYSKNKENSEKAKAYILSITKTYEAGDLVSGKVFRVETYGAFVKILENGEETNKEGLIHISAISKSRIKDINDFIKMGDILECKVTEVNDKGQIALELATKLG